ncbi:hypothetical protein KHA80_20875 [Anaerobacillus sp. HL2]|nr:hypothetical protein KHA80_20875 [Anaerobacillus sp. HL2]
MPSTLRLKSLLFFIIQQMTILVIHLFIFQGTFKKVIRRCIIGDWTIAND